MNHVNHLPRVNPRRPVFIGASGLPRIVLGQIGEGDNTLLQTRNDAHDAPKAIRTSGPFSQSILVATCSERGHLTDHAREVIAAAAILANANTEVLLAVLGECVDDVAHFAVDKVIIASDFDMSGWHVDAATAWFDQIVRKYSPSQILVADNPMDGDFGRRYAAKYGVDTQAHVVELNAESARIRVNAQFDRLLPHAHMMLLERGVANTKLPYIGLGVVEASPAFTTQAVTGVEDLGVQIGDAQTMSLEDADFILSAGHGVSAADLPLFHELASALGAVTGASRVAVDDGRFTRDRQVGATGKTVKASTYIALGISGAVQHLQGIKECRHVISVNLDEAAPMTRRANLTVVTETRAWMQAALQEIRNLKAKKGEQA